MRLPGSDGGDRAAVTTRVGAGRTGEASDEADEGLEHADETFSRSVEEGDKRLSRSTSSLLATGAIGGIDVGLGVLALFVVSEATGNDMAAAVAFGVGFVALTLGGSELFTENFLVPISAWAATDHRFTAVLRLWGGTLVANLAGGHLVATLLVVGFPDLGPTALEHGQHFADRGIGSSSFASAVVAGLAITVMTWMLHGTHDFVARLIAAVSIGFVLAATPLNHAVVMSIEMFAALGHGAPFGYLDWLGMFAWSSLGNLVGGIGLVTLLRLLQVSGGRLREEQRGRSASRA